MKLSSIIRSHWQERNSEKLLLAKSLGLILLVGYGLLDFEIAAGLIIVAPVFGVALTIILEALKHVRLTKFEGLSFHRETNIVDGIATGISAGCFCLLLVSSAGGYGPVLFAVTLAVTCKYFIPGLGKDRPGHLVNGVALGVVGTLLIIPNAQYLNPYLFDKSGPVGNIIVSLAVIGLGGLWVTQNRRWPVVLGCFSALFVQALFRYLLIGTSLAPLGFLTGTLTMVYLLFLIPDPDTTPTKVKSQYLFGICVGGAYGLLMALGYLHALFLSLVIISAARGFFLTAIHRHPQMESMDGNFERRNAA